jgi:excinuclease ABC subunit C
VLAHSIPFSPERDAEAFALVPTCGGVFMLRGAEAGSEPYVSKAANLRRRIMRLLAATGEQGVSKRLNLRERCASIEFSPTGSEFENIVLLYRTLREVFPETYAKRMRFNLSPLIRINWENAYPRAYVTRKAGRIAEKARESRKSVYFGPFQSRAIAENALNDTLDLFKSRRCTFELNPDPTFPGCVYSEMKMCLAPCFKGCSDVDYMAEIGRVQDFLETRGRSLLDELERERDRESAELDFEAAAGIHTRVEKVKSVARNFDEIVRPLEELDAVIVQRAVDCVDQPDASHAKIAIFRFVQGQVLGPAIFAVPERAAAASEASAQDEASLEAEVPKILATSQNKADESALAQVIGKLEPKGKSSGAGYMEQLSILKRWYYRGSRVGEIFFRDAKGNWPVRRIVRGAIRVVAGDHTVIYS